MRSVARILILIASTLLAVVLLDGAASAAVCSTAFGSLPKDDPAMGTGEVDTCARVGTSASTASLSTSTGHPPATTSATSTR